VRVSSRIWGSGKAAQIQEEGNGSLKRERVGWGGGGQESKVSARSTPQSESRHQNVRKNTTHKESSQEKSHVQEQGLMAGSNCQAGWGKMAQPRLWARSGFYRRGRLKKSAHARESPIGVDLVLEHRNFCLSMGLLLGMASFLK
jgi:hypothetical protein